MEKNNNSKVIAVVALVVAVVALSVGFAAFADQLTINGTATAEVSGNPFEDSTNGLNYKSNTQECHSTADATVSVIHDSYSAGTLNEDDWTGISVPLTTAIPSVTCTAKVENKTAYTAWLQSIGANGGVTCSSTGSNATANANSVCATVNVEVQVGSVATDKITFGTTQPSTNSTTSGSISPTGEATVTVKISYTPASVIADEDVTITLPTITHSYSSASNPNAASS